MKYSLPILLLLVSGLISKPSLSSDEQVYTLDIDKDGVYEKIATSNFDDYLNIYKNGILILNSSNLIIDGYSILKEIENSDNGFIIVNQGNNFDAEFKIYVNYKNKEYIIEHIDSYLNFISNSVFSISIVCKKDVHYFLADTTGSDLEPFILSQDNEQFDVFCSKTTFTSKKLSWFEKSIKERNIPINGTLIQDMVETYPISKSNQVTYNNIAFYLYELGEYHHAISILESIIDKVPNRIVAYINLADSYKSIGEYEKAKENYRTYMKLMINSDKKNKIPDRVYKEIKISIPDSGIK